MFRSNPLTGCGDPRHARPVRHRRVEPLLWLASAAHRCWRWVWSVDHDELVATVAARLTRFALLATLFFAVVVASS